MKNLFLLLLACLVANSAFTQHDHSGHTGKPPGAGTTTATVSNNQRQMTDLLLSYYNIKNALVVGDPTSAASNAGSFLRTVNSIDYKIISEGNIHILGKDAGRIEGSRDLQKQRAYFELLSSNMITVARAIKLADQPVYVQYCPMKKASWLSAEKEIRNPYYGSSMLSCGEIAETIN